ncbi:MAG TPA: helix-turn-helix transcriptional regulator, partial [Rugosimonospora sp.]|nr:helix-turn-helix transcriptional regulator [Rugosimonospora sp.]
MNRSGRQPQTFGELLRGYRLSAGLTQRELAERAGVSVRALRDIEQGRVRRPQAPSVQRFADALPLAEPD